MQRFVREVDNLRGKQFPDFQGLTLQIKGKDSNEPKIRAKV